MTAQTRSILYTYFETGDKPNQSQFADLIDSNLNLATVSAQFITADISCGGTVDVSGNFTVLNSALTNLTGNLTVAGATNFYTAIATQNAVSAAFNGPVLFNSNITVAQSANAAFTGNIIVSGKATIAGNETITGTLTPSGGIVGTTTNVAIGNVGEIISATATDASVALAANTAKTVTTIALQAGNYNVWGSIRFTADAATTFTTIEAILSVNADAAGNTPEIFVLNNTFTTGASVVIHTPTLPVVVATSTNYFLNAYCTFAVSGMNVGGILTARRVI